MQVFYELTNIFFFVFHSLLILFNSLGWLLRQTRRLNLVCLVLTFLSWFFLGIWHGWGYCLCTDWHWKVRDKLGLKDMSYSYNHFLIKKIFDVDLSLDLVNQATLIIFFFSLGMSAWLNIRDFKKARSQKRQ